jgi:hypothetical protein
MKFSLANSILNHLRTTIKISFVKYNKGRKSGYNTAVGLFLINAIRGDYPNFEVNFSAVEISKGTLPGLDKWEFSVNDNELLLKWNNEHNKPNAYADDGVYLVIFNLPRRSFIIIDTAKRADKSIKSISCIIPTSQKDDNVAWAFVVNRDNSNSSNSHFLGKFEI